MFAAVFLLVAVVSPPHMAAAATYKVGGSIGWMPSDSNNPHGIYAGKLSVGDILLFNFTTGEQDVLEVTKAAFDFCNSVDPISFEKVGPVRITISAVGFRYFICSFPDHCDAGQKLSIKINEAISPPPAAAPSPLNKPKTRFLDSPPRPPRPDNTIWPPPPPNYGNSLRDFDLLFSAGLAIAVVMIY